MKKQPQGTVNIGRPGPFGNPVVIGWVCPHCGRTHHDAGSTLPCYKAMLWSKLRENPSFRAAVKALITRPLWCPGCGRNAENCHGRVLEKACLWLNSEDGEKHEWRD